MKNDHKTWTQMLQTKTSSRQTDQPSAPSDSVRPAPCTHALCSQNRRRPSLRFCRGVVAYWTFIAQASVKLRHFVILALSYAFYASFDWRAMPPTILL